MAKKIIALLLSLTVLFVILPACGDDGESKDTTTAAEGDSSAETTTAAETTTVATTTEETTPKETEPPKEYERTSVMKVDFAAMPDGDAPFGGNNVENVRIEGGLLKGTGTSGDPHIPYNGGDINFPAESVQEIHIKLKNYSASYAFQFFFTTETVGWSEGASFRFTCEFSGDDGDDNDWNIIVLDTWESADWEGTITNFRLDPSSAEGDFEFEYVDFISVTEKA